MFARADTKKGVKAAQDFIKTLRKDG